IESLAGLGKSMGVLTKDITGIIRDLLVIRTCKTASAILGLPENRFKTLSGIAGGVSEARLIRVLEIFAQAENELRYATSSRVVFETAAIKAARPEAEYDIDALLSRVKALEDRLAGGTVLTQTVKKDESKAVAEESAGRSGESDKISAESVSSDEIKGKSLFNLRAGGSEMLWNAMQKIGIDTVKGDIILVPATPEDYALLNIDANRAKIENALS
ncbi:MAG: hypothetical protein J6Y43_07485, partial [Clostridia bacterium]|nr:hypothetical protein [Clostridia bacterium]